MQKLMTGLWLVLKLNTLVEYPNINLKFLLKNAS